MLACHLVPLILHAEEDPLKPPHYFKSHYCEYGDVVVPEMGREFVGPRAPENQVATDYPVIDLQINNKENIRIVIFD